jgi:trimethylamine:corrinoid methyltransferase-like protein
VLLARRYGLAGDCYGPTTDSMVADAQLGWEHAFNAYLGLRARPRFLSGIGDVAAGVASSVEVLVLDDEILNDAFYGLRQPPCDTDALDIDAMCAGVLSDAGFLGSTHTRRYIHSDLCAPMIRFRVGLAEWAASGRRSVVDAARERAEAILAKKPVGLPDDVAEELCRLIATAAKEIGLTEWLDARAVVELVLA